MTTAEAEAKRGGWSWWYLLFLVEFVAVLWPSYYNRVEPAWSGVPFFYWYQMLCVLVGAAINAFVYFVRER